MEKYYIVNEGCKLYDNYKYYRDMSNRINDAFEGFAKENDIKTSEYYPVTNRLWIVAAEEDKEKYSKYFTKGEAGHFKKSAPLCKKWITRCNELGLVEVRYPWLAHYFGSMGRGNSTQFEHKGKMYLRFANEDERNFREPEGLTEIKASEYYTMLEQRESEDK